MPGAVGGAEAEAEDKGEDRAFSQLTALGRGWTQMSDKSRQEDGETADANGGREASGIGTV